LSEAQAPQQLATDPAREPQSPSPLARMLIRLGALVLIGAILFVFHGIKYYLDPWSQAVINGIVKYVYPSDGQAETTVVLFREENLRMLKEPYPVSYERHAEILEALSIYHPRAVFLDFVFLDKRSREATETLRQAICNLREAKIDVYLAVLEPMTPPDSNEPWVFDCAVQVSAQMAPVYAASGVLTYAHGFDVDAKFLPTAAFAMAASKLKLEPRAAQDMEIIWGNGVSELNQRWMSECKRGGTWFSHLLSIFTNTSSKMVKLRCPYTQTITVTHLLGSSGDADVARVLKDGAVFYGAAFNLTGDRVASPVFEELPGVYLHAMAYDNLVTLRNDYKRAERALLIPSLTGRQISVPLTGVVDAMLLFATVIILLLVEEPPPAVQKFRTRFTQISTSHKWIVLGVITALVVAAIVTKASPLAALGLLLLMIAITLLDLAPPSERPPVGTLQGFVLQRLLALVVPILAVVAFIAVDRWLGLEAALLLIVLPGYFVYKVVVGRDLLFAATSGLLVLAALVLVSPPVNLGPRNVIAYVAFFEVARKLLHHADTVAVEYRKRRDAYPKDKQWGKAAPLMPILDKVFAVCQRTVVPAEPKRENKEETHAKPAGAPA
jgi:CHASE2 domain-containing sensor protein